MARRLGLDNVPKGNNMKDCDWIGRLVEFRDSKTLGEAKCASVFDGRILSVFREDNILFAIAQTRLVKKFEICTRDTNPDPRWTYEQYQRRKHHRTIYNIDHRYTPTLIFPCSKRNMLIYKSKKSKWKPVRDD